MRLILWTLACLVQLATGAQLTEDEGLRKACTEMDGHYTARNPPNDKANEGDVCQMKFRTGTRNKQEAEQFCSIYAPWRLQFAEHGLPTICNVEATLMCEPGWIQMFGQCFRMPDKKKMKTRAEAEAECSSITINEGKIKGKIAYLHHKYIVGAWKNYFHGVQRVWVDASEAYDKVIQYGKDTDGSLALLFNGITSDFAVQHKSLAKVPEDSRMQVLCEYQPDMTVAEIIYKAKRYNDIYHQLHPMAGGLVVRTTNRYHYNDGGLISLCRAPLKAFDMVVNDVFRPTITSTAILQNVQNSFTFDGLFHPVDWQNECSLRENKIFSTSESGFKSYKNQTCDNMQVEMFRHRPQGHSWEVASAARDGSVWCRVGNGKQRDFVLPHGWFSHRERASGKGYGYMVLQGKYSFNDAEKECQTMGAHLAGADSLDELEEMIGYFNWRNYDNMNAWIGGQRKAECDNVPNFNSDRKDPCSRSNVFQWNHGAGENGFREDWWATDKDGLQNPTGGPQKCLALILHTNGAADPSKGGVLDDNHCDRKSPAICGIYLQERVS